MKNCKEELEKLVDLLKNAGKFVESLKSIKK